MINTSILWEGGILAIVVLLASLTKETRREGKKWQMLKRPYTYASHVSKFEIEMPIHIVNSCLRLKSSKSVCVDDQSPERIESDQVTLFNIISLLSA